MYVCMYVMFRASPGATVVVHVPRGCGIIVLHIFTGTITRVSGESFSNSIANSLRGARLYYILISIETQGVKCQIALILQRMYIFLYFIQGLENAPLQ